MSNIIVRFLDPEQYYLLEEFCEQENLPMLHPEWSKVVAAIDLDTQKVVGIMVAQMQVHVEPIWIKEGYRNGKLSTELADSLDGYLDGLAVAGGREIAVWANPTNPAAVKICRIRGFQQCEKPVYTKTYTGDRLAQMFLETKGEESWQQQYQPQSESDPQ